MNMEISPIYKVGDIEFETEEEAQAYIDKMNEQNIQQQKFENEREEDLKEIVSIENLLNDMYIDYERKYMYLPNRSNNIKELLKNNKNNVDNE